ncbi:helix-turn-helix transcriptional regulator [Aquimarina sp. U1-2]|uniref:AraC family transcriptional regulator n=1 Tax=Aquimarina sp. U1-2 TaxID=2823141 RepID=UPI001AECAA88|nr:AraC family transcriptional regulator [Aquimarina sp. U1-2]MBP2833100.1 helix-turn-helix transcriptional regulator [Aquimarina sp. U1-2]
MLHTSTGHHKWDMFEDQHLHFEFTDISKNVVNGQPYIFGAKEGSIVELMPNGRYPKTQERPILLDGLSRQLLARLMSELKIKDEPTDIQYLNALVHSLVAHLLCLRYRHDVDILGMGLTPVQVGKVTTYMNKHLAASITLKDLANSLNLSQGYLSSRFKQSTGLSPFNYLKKLRMEKALELLQHTDMLIIQIGMEVGINNHSQFCRTFKKFFGHPPSHIRKATSSASLPKNRNHKNGNGIQ